ncbi:MAG TPA: ABC transporter ATP-binding protein [Chloroflexia bacterium]|jgi:ABC-type multidrug transport system ATPase subunit
MELVVDNISKQYGERWALKDISIRCGTGMLGLVGPNGAGKTTLMRIIATLLDQTGGQVSWNGRDTREDGALVRMALGYLPQDFGLYPELTARQFLRYIAAMKAVPANLARARVDEVIELVHLERDADRKLGTYSGGMKQRVGIAQALLNDPELLIVDEPTAGLDPEERIRFRILLSGLTSDRLIILSTHIIGDVEAVANRLVLLKEGRVVGDTTPQQLVAEAHGCVWSLVTGAANAGEMQAKYKISALAHTPEGILLRLVSPTRPSEEAVAVEPTLEDAYLLKMAS